LNVAPDQEIDADAVMQIRLGLDARQNILEGTLIYRVQRKHAESAQDESKHIWLLIAWNGEYAKVLHVCALLIEHNKKLNEDRLRKLYQICWPSLKARVNTIQSN
jgi:hypothetical protein